MRCRSASRALAIVSGSAFGPAPESSSILRRRASRALTVLSESLDCDDAVGALTGGTVTVDSGRAGAGEGAAVNGAGAMVEGGVAGLSCNRWRTASRALEM